MDCPACGQPVEEVASECPSCGTDTRLTVRAPDGTPYGPYTLADIHRYSAEGRIPAASTLQADDGRIVTLAEVGLVTAPPVAVQAASARSGTPGWLVAVIIAVVAAVLLPTILILTTILFPVLVKSREKARQASCQSNVKQLCLACLRYASDNNNTLPDAATWQQDIQPYLTPNFTWDCPSSHRGHQSYEFNPSLSGRSLAAIDDPARTPMLYDGSLGSGSGPHSRGWNVGFVDGFAKWMRQSGISQLQGMGGPGP